MAEIYQRSKLLNRYYEKVGRAFAGVGSCPRAVTFSAGYGLVNEAVADGALPELLNIPADIEDVTNVFYTGSVTAAYSNGATVCNCEIPKGAVSNAVKCNMIGIYDNDGELIAVCTTLPDWVTPTEGYKFLPTITFPVEEV